MQPTRLRLWESGSLDPERVAESGSSSDGRQSVGSADEYTAGRNDARYEDPDRLEWMYSDREMSAADIAEEGGLSCSGVYYWMEKLGVERRDQERAVSGAVADAQRVPESDLQADVRRVARELQAPPTRAEYAVHGAYHSETVRRRIGNGSWASALESIGV